MVDKEDKKKVYELTALQSGNPQTARSLKYLAGRVVLMFKNM